MPNNGFSYPTYPPPTSWCANNGVINCNDIYSILIYTILYLKAAGGSTLDEIYDAAPIICPTFNMDIDVFQTWVTTAVKRGILVIGTPGTYAVNARMCLVNPINNQYFCLFQLFKC